MAHELFNVVTFGGKVCPGFSILCISVVIRTVLSEFSPHYYVRPYFAKQATF